MFLACTGDQQGSGAPQVVAAKVSAMHPLQSSRHGAVKDQSIPALESSLHLHTSAGWVGPMMCYHLIHPILTGSLAITGLSQASSKTAECHLWDMSDLSQDHDSDHAHESQSNKVWGACFRIAVRARMCAALTAEFY